MQILDVIRKLNTENEISFLLSAYVETLPLYDFARSLPQGVTALLLTGMEDVRGRFEALLDIELSGSVRHAGERVHAIVREATEIFGVAFTRLRTLHEATAAPVARDIELIF